MAIQFLCPSCAQPIEVDDEWADRAVACPYCRHTVTAPVASTYEPGISVPTARVLAPLVGAAPQTAGANKVAVAAMVLSCLWLAVYLAGNALLGPAMRDALGDDPTREDVSKYTEKVLETGDVPGWMVGMFVFLVAMLAIWVAGLVCAVMGLRGQRRRRLAVGSLLILGLLPVLECAGVLSL